MVPAARSTSSASTRLSTITLWLSLLFVTGITTGCGSSGITPTPPKLSGNTAVTVLLSSTANDQLSQFNLTFQTLTLTSQSGKTVSLLSA